MAKILVVGGAGYVGSAVCAWLLSQGHDIWILDDLSKGRRELLLSRQFVHARAGDTLAVSRLLKQVTFDCVMHFAALSLVGESVQKPALYFENNVKQTQALLDCMLEHGVTRFVFSSTCAVFGDVGSKEKIHEALPKKPINPYGETKLKVESMLEELSLKRGLQAVALRYFNAAGAEDLGRVGELHDPETHLIPNVLRAAASGGQVDIYGTDYPTPDGTCIRDYIHVTDLARGHEAAMLRLLALPTGEGRFEAFNLGSENGYSVKEVIDACGEVTALRPQVSPKPRRPGDPSRLVADSSLAKSELGFGSWGLRDLKSIVESAWHWESKRRGMKLKAIFLDRDGTLNEDPGYLSESSALKLLPQVGEALALLQEAGFRLVVVSNQSGVGRGLIQASELPRIHDRLDELLRPYAAFIDSYELCLHRPEDECECRKPKAKLILDAAVAHSIDLGRSYMVGDKQSDLGAGALAGCRHSILVRTGSGRDSESKLGPQAPVKADFIADSLLEAVRWILDQENAGS